MVQDIHSEKDVFLTLVSNFPLWTKIVFLCMFPRDNGCKQQLYVCIIHISLEN